MAKENSEKFYNNKMPSRQKKSFQQWILIIAILILIFLFISLMKIFSKRKNVEYTINSLEQEIVDLEKKNKQLIDLVQYLNTATFVESEARNKFNLVKPNENVVIVKDDQDKSSIDVDDNLHADDQVLQKSNVEKWKEYFLR